MKQMSPSASRESECAQWTWCPARRSVLIRDGTKSLIHESLSVRMVSLPPRIPVTLA